MIDIQKLKPRRSPEPNRPFVNRTSEINLIQKKVNIAIRSEPIHLAITCFWGPFGMGKSWLLRELERQYRFSGLRDAGGNKPTLAARLDLNRDLFPVLWENNEIKREELIRELWKQLANQLNIETTILEQASPEEWANEFVAQVTSWSSDYIVLIMLDTIDDLIRKNEDSFFWLEQNLIERLVLTGKVLLIFTSRGELRTWRRFQVRQRVDSHRLTAFDSEVASKEINTDISTSQIVFTHAFGHPLVTDYIGTLLEKDENNKELVDLDSKGMDLSSIRDVLREVINEIFSPLSESMAKITKYISVLRWVSAESLRYLTEKLNVKQQGHGDVYYLDQITTLQSNHLLYWNNMQKNYEFDTVLRQLMTHFLEIDDSHLFGLANMNAFTFHLEHLDKYPQYLARYIPELLYHRALLEKCASTENAPIKFQEWWGQFLITNSTTISTDVWKELLIRLEQDEELHKLALDDYEILFSDTKAKVNSKEITQ